MVSIDMGAIPETLFESELFGHKKGAFTDATADRQGKMEQANGSTLFLDEIGNLPLHLQSKLLVAIQSRTITPLGASKSLNIDIRLISATNRNLFDMVERGEFRQDLLFRINTIIIHLPPLRSRVEDIIPLAEIFLKHYSEKYGRDIDGITSKATEQMIAYQWNGNIRELQNTMEKAVILCDERMIQPQHLQLQSYTSTVSQPITTLEDLERKTIADAIHTCNGNLSVVAQKLGITRQTLYNKIKRYGL
jgi:transcriptional regulator with PAS, ATPase and Fis domain